MTGTVAVVDYGLCNIDSVRRALEECGAAVTVTTDPRDLRTADRIVLPGVGSFRDGMAALRERSLDAALTEEVLVADAPFLGVCLGMQLIAECGTEGGETPGLGWVPGVVRRLEPTADDRRVPHMGWNEVHRRSDATLFRGVADGADFYFVHSYHVDAPTDVIAAVTPYCGGVAAAVEKDNVFGVQFHPEKSQRNGFQVLRNFLAV